MIEVVSTCMYFMLYFNHRGMLLLFLRGVVSVTEHFDAMTSFSHLVIWHQQDQSDEALVLETLEKKI